jgi:outer membrane protein OmpA-like peptidoglycan-associated protein
MTESAEVKRRKPGAKRVREDSIEKHVSNRVGETSLRGTRDRADASAALQRRAAVLPVARPATPLTATESQFAHDLSRIPTNSAEHGAGPLARAPETGQAPGQGGGGQTTQSVYRISVYMDHDGTRWKLMIDEKSTSGESKLKGVSYIKGNQFAWLDTEESGDLIDRWRARDIAIQLTWEAEDKMRVKMQSGELKLSQEQFEACQKKLEEMRTDLTKIYGKVTSRKSREEEKKEYQEEMKDSRFSVVSYMEDIVHYRKGTGTPRQPAATTPEQEPEPEAPAETPETPAPEQPVEINIPRTIVIDRFPFNLATLPTGGQGIDWLNQLCALPDSTKARILITSIEGHTDRVPVRRGSRRLRSLAELSDMRAEAVRAVLEGAGFDTPSSNVLRSADDAQVERSATHQERARDRKVVIRWNLK